MALYLRPDADDVDGNWLNESGNNTNLYASLDETTAGDSDYIVSPNDPIDEVCRVALSNPVGTPTEPFKLRYRFNNVGGSQLRVRLMQGATPIAMWTESGTGWTTAERTLTSPEFASITDFNNLFVEFKAHNTDPTMTLDLDFAAMATLDSKVTFTRSTTATYYNSAGLLVIAPINGPRLTYDPTTLAALGLLREGQSTNLLLHSGDLANAAWTQFVNGSGTASRTANTGVAPDGMMTAALISLNRSSAADWAQGAAQTFSNPYSTGACSVYLKAYAGGDVGKVIDIMFYNGSNVALTPVTLTANWVRYSVTTPSSGSGSPQFIIGYVSNSVTMGGGAAPSTTTGPVQFLAWGAQAESHPFASFYIPTTTATVVRAAENAGMTGTNLTSWYYHPVGTFVVEGRGVLRADGHILATNIFPYFMRHESNLNVLRHMTEAFTNPYHTLAAGFSFLTDPYKFALSWNSGVHSGNLTGNGMTPSTAAGYNPLNPITDGVFIGDRYDNVYPTFGTIKRLRFYNVTKTDAEMAALTA